MRGPLCSFLHKLEHLEPKPARAQQDSAAMAGIIPADGSSEISVTFAPVKHRMEQWEEFGKVTVAFWRNEKT